MGISGDKISLRVGKTHFFFVPKRRKVETAVIVLSHAAAPYVIAIQDRLRHHAAAVVSSRTLTSGSATQAPSSFLFSVTQTSLSPSCGKVTSTVSPSKARI